MEPSKETRTNIHSLLNTQRLCVLSTSRQDRPYASLVAFAVTNALKQLYFATARTTRKYANIIENPHVALLVDSSANRGSDFHDAMAVTIIAPAGELTSPSRDMAESIFLARHPYLTDFVRAESCALFCAEIQRFILVERFQNVIEYIP